MFCIAQTILAPGTLQLITISQSAAKAIGEAFGALQASNHGGDVDVSLFVLIALRNCFATNPGFRLAIPVPSMF